MAGSTPGVIVRPFEAPDQDAARRLILEGLGGHFGFIDGRMNPDLDDIGVSYAGKVFLVAEVDGRIAGTGALTLHGDGVMEVVRMSTDGRLRRTGIATLVLAALTERARLAGCTTLVLETKAAWDDAVGFYMAAGFREDRRYDDEIVFTMAL